MPAVGEDSASLLSPLVTIQLTSEQSQNMSGYYHDEAVVRHLLTITHTMKLGRCGWISFGARLLAWNK
jgi:hypothetical protein